MFVSVLSSWGDLSPNSGHTEGFLRSSDGRFDGGCPEAAAAAAAEAATAAAAGVIRNIGGRGRPPKIGWYLSAGVCKNRAAIFVYKSNCG